MIAARTCPIVTRGKGRAGFLPVVPSVPTIRVPARTSWPWYDGVGVYPGRVKGDPPRPFSSVRRRGFNPTRSGCTGPNAGPHGNPHLPGAHGMLDTSRGSTSLTLPGVFGRPALSWEG